MESKVQMKPGAQFRTLNREELFKTNGGGVPTGPLPLSWMVALILEKLRNREDQ